MFFTYDRKFDSNQSIVDLCKALQTTFKNFQPM